MTSNVIYQFCNNKKPDDFKEMFIRYLAEQAVNVVKSDRKPRRNIQYKDLGMARYSRNFDSRIC